MNKFVTYLSVITMILCLVGCATPAAYERQVSCRQDFGFGKTYSVKIYPK